MLNIKRELKRVYKKLGFNEKYAGITFSARTELCDFQNNGAFQVAKEIGKNPFEVAKQIADNLKLENAIVSACQPAFVNITLTNKVVSEIANDLINDSNFGIKKAEEPKNILMDYGGANIAKELHMGHLRSPLIGESLKRVFKLLGHNVISDSHLGDWGMQIGLTIAQLEEDGHLGYFFNNEKTRPQITLDLLNEEYPKASKRKNDLDFKKKADDYTLYVQQKKEPYYEIYKLLKANSVKKIEENYKKLNCFFDYWYGESDAEDYINETIKIFADKKLSYKSEGAVVVDVERENETRPMPPLLLQKSNEGALYATTDLATILMRNKTMKLDSIYYVADYRQSLHFEQVFRAAKLSGLSPETQKLIHVSFGTMNGKDGKPFKTRDGETIKLEDVINMLTDAALVKLKQNGVEDKDELALKIGVASMKFGDLINFTSKDYIFDIEKFSSFEGKTGPYLQYTAARIKSLLNKSEIGDKSCKINIESNYEKTIVINILKLNESFYNAIEENSLSGICNSVYNVASAYATLYANTKILTEENKERRESLIGISKLVLKALEITLDILAIDIPEKM